MSFVCGALRGQVRQVRPSASHRLNTRAVTMVVRPTAASPRLLRRSQPLALDGRARRVAVARRSVRVSAAATTPSTATPWERLQGAQVLRGTDGVPVELVSQWCVCTPHDDNVDPPSYEHAWAHAGRR